MPRHDYIRYGRDVRVSTQPDGRGYYRVRWTDPTTRQPRDARRSTWDEAEQFAFELAGLIEHPEDLPAEERRHAPLAALFEEYLDVAKTRGLLKVQTWRTRRSYLLSRVAPIVGEVACGDWDREVTWQVVDALRAQGLRESTIASVLRGLSAAATFGVERGYLPEGANPAKGIRLQTDPDRHIDRDELPTAADIEKLATCMVEITGRPWRTLQPLLCAYSGLRVGEMLALHGSDIDLETGTIKIERQVLTAVPGAKVEAPKYNSRRQTIYPAWLDDEIAARVAEVGDGPLFPGVRYTHEPYRSFCSIGFDPARERAGWPRDSTGRHRWSIHTLRHYFCTWALSSDGLGLDVADVQRFAGHRDPSTTWRLYVQTRPGRFDRAREASRRAAR